MNRQEQQDFANNMLAAGWRPCFIKKSFLWIHAKSSGKKTPVTVTNETALAHYADGGKTPPPF